MATTSSTSPDPNPETGVYYSSQDLAGFWVRVAVLAIDLALVGAAVLLLFLTNELAGLPEAAVNTAALAVAWAYLAGLKAGPKGTLGYQALGLRLVGLSGEPATLAQCTLRFMFLFFGPLNGFVDSLWLASDPNRQALRDKFARTYVIRAGALPAGSGPIVYTNYFIAALSFLFAEVRRPDPCIPEA
jgi:uncharacterized RDD family membrane protein YckC